MHKQTSLFGCNSTAACPTLLPVLSCRVRESRKCNWQVRHGLVVRLGGCSFISSASSSGNSACFWLLCHCLLRTNEARLPKV